MAKSIYEILDSLETETSVPDYGMVKHTLPRQLLPTAEEFEDEEKLVAWAERNGVTYAAIQRGVQKLLIDLRAKFKAGKKGETWTEEKGQAAVNGAEWTITKRPNSAKSAFEVATNALAKLSPEELKDLLAKHQEK